MTTSSAGKNSSDFRPDINGLRAIAVAAVVLFHFNVPGFSGGFAGVDIFFVISGFLMTKIIVSKLIAGSFSILDFYRARARRILPALAGLCAFMLAFGWLSLDPRSYAPMSLHAASSLSFVSNFIYWQEAGYFDSVASEKWLLHTWSLSVEWQFYLLFPLAMFVVWTATRKRRDLLLAIAATFFTSLALSIMASSRHLEFSYYLLPTRAWEMMAGGLVYFLTPYFSPNPTLSRILGYSGLLLIVIAASQFDSRIPWPGYFAAIPVAGAALIILAQDTGSPISNNPVSALLGNASYSIYLWHWPIAVCLTFRQLQDDWLSRVIGMATALMLGYLSYRWIELPSRSTGRTLKPKTESLAYSGSATVLICLALTVYFANGLTDRLNNDESNYLAAAAAKTDWQHPGNNCAKRDNIVYCERKGSSTETTMFIGDSIAEQWYPRYGAPQSDYSQTILFVTRSGCPPIRNLDGYPPGKHCSEATDLIWKAVRDRQPQRLVISSAWWPNFFYPDGALRGEDCILESGSCMPITTNAHLQQAFRVLESDIQNAIANGTRVFIIGPVPTGKIDYAEARQSQLANKQLVIPLTKTWQDMPGFADDKQSYQAGLATLDDANSATPGFRPENSGNSPPGSILGLLTGIAKRTGAMLVVPANYMCPEQRCPLTDNSGVPIYMDYAHLRAEYVKSTALLWMDSAIGIGNSPY